MYALRRWSVRHARGLNWFYRKFEAVLVAGNPVWRAIGYERLERPMAAMERVVKGALFDCKIADSACYDATGMSCPMNCQSSADGPCGGAPKIASAPRMRSSGGPMASAAGFRAERRRCRRASRPSTAGCRTSVAARGAEKDGARHG
jgi:hypothetical protein